MEQSQAYVLMAEEAGKEGAHIAAAMYYRSAAESAPTPMEMVAILEKAVAYALPLKKPADQLAICIWAGQVIAEKGLQGSPLESTVQEAIAKIRQESGGNVTA